MEFCSLSLDERRIAARQNVIQTYIGLASQIDGASPLSHPNFTGVLSLSPHSFCNFCIGLDAKESERHAVVTDLLALALRQSALRVFAMTDDAPGPWNAALEQAGFRSLHHLVQMAWSKTSGRSDAADWEIETSQEGRMAVARFMASQFFALNAPAFRRAVIQATADGPHELWRIGTAQEMIGAGMIVESQGAIGLYNLCVAPPHRGRGIGESIVRAAQDRASKAGKPVVLQCDPSLTHWYHRFGFESIGEILSFHHRF